LDNPRGAGDCWGVDVRQKKKGQGGALQGIVEGAQANSQQNTIKILFGSKGRSLYNRACSEKKGGKYHPPKKGSSGENGPH